jgi:hypothetical protein
MNVSLLRVVDNLKSSTKNFLDGFPVNYINTVLYFYWIINYQILPDYFSSVSRKYPGPAVWLHDDQSAV